MSSHGHPSPQSSRLKPGSQNHRIIAALERNGGWMDTAQIHREVGFCRLNSRVAELRSLGYDIPTRHVAGGVGPHATEYRLAGTPGEVEQVSPAGQAANHPAPPACSTSPDGPACADWGPDGSRPSETFEQLRLVA